MKTKAENWNSFWNAYLPHNSNISYSKKRIIEILENTINENSIIADAGCGSGFFSNYFLSKSKMVYSLDYSDEALRLCKKNCNNQTILLNIDFLSKNMTQECGQKFDFIFSDGLLEHFDFPEQKQILQNFINSLTKQGKIITFVPNRFSPWQIIRPIFMPNIKEEPFILRNLVKLHELCGLTVEQSGGLNVLPIEYSPDKQLGKYFGMLLYVICSKK